MGWRGAASGKSYAKDGKTIAYGDEYKTILAVENIRFIEYKLGSSTPPWETMSALQNRVYAVVTDFDKLKNIIIFDKNGKRARQIDLDHSHDKIMPHTHIGYEHNTKGIPLSAAEKKLANKIVEIWEEYKMGSNYHWVANNTVEHIKGIIEEGQVLTFQFREKDYFIENRENGYVIQDPHVDENGNFHNDMGDSDYPENEKAKTAEEMWCLPFLDGKTILEAFDEIKFFD